MGEKTLKEGFKLVEGCIDGIIDSVDIGIEWGMPDPAEALLIPPFLPIVLREKWDVSGNNRSLIFQELEMKSSNSNSQIFNLPADLSGSPLFLFAKDQATMKEIGGRKILHLFQPFSIDGKRLPNQGVSFLPERWKTRPLSLGDICKYQYNYFIQRPFSSVSISKTKSDKLKITLKKHSMANIPVKVDGQGFIVAVQSSKLYETKRLAQGGSSKLPKKLRVYKQAINIAVLNFMSIETNQHNEARRVATEQG